MLPQLKNLSQAALDLIFPRWCIGCGREGDYLCNACLGSLRMITPPVCPRCGRPVSGEPLPGGCPNCADWAAAIDGVRAPFLFSGVIREAIHEFKYRNLRALVPRLAGLLYRYLAANPVPADILVPVPLHPKRLRERGYNQSALLARDLGRLAGLTVVAGGLTRRRYTLPQARSSGIQERHASVTGAFACRDGLFKGQRIMLIDDVSTSGATLNACAGALKSGGAVSVWGLTIALEQ